MSKERLFAAVAPLALVVSLAAPVHAAVSRPAIADLHGQGDLADIAIGISVLVQGSLVHSEKIIDGVVDRLELSEAFAEPQLPPRAGLWVSPGEARLVCGLVRCKQLLTGTLHRDASQLFVVLRLYDEEGSLIKVVKLTHPLRELSRLPQIVAERARKLLEIEAPAPPALRRSTLAALGRAWIAVQKRDVEQAVVELARVGRVMPGSVRFAFADIVTLVRKIGEIPYTKARALEVADPAAAAKEAGKLADANPTDVSARFLYARALIDAGRAREAIEVLKSRPGEPDVAEQYLLRGRALLLLKDLGKAKEALREAVELADDNADARFMLGQVLALTHDSQAAPELIEAAVWLRKSSDPRATDALLRAIACEPRATSAYEALDPSDLAPDDVLALRRSVAEMVRQGTPERVTAALAHALIATDAGALTASLRELRALLSEAATPAAQKGPLGLALGRAAAEQGDFALAAQGFAAAYAAKPSPWLALDLGYVNRAAGMLDRAREMFDKAGSDPGLEAAAASEVGPLMLARGDARGAARRLGRARDAFPDDAQVRFRLALALARSGDAQGAAAERAAALGLDPEIAVQMEAEAAPPAAPANAPGGDKPGAGVGTRSSSDKPPGGLLPQLAALLHSLLESSPLSPPLLAGGAIALVIAWVLVRRLARGRLGRPGRAGRAGRRKEAIPVPMDGGLHTGAQELDPEAFGSTSARPRPASRPPATLAIAAILPPIDRSNDAILIKVMDYAVGLLPGTSIPITEKQPVFGAAVWLDGEEQTAVYTDKSSGGALLTVTPGEHLLHVRGESKEVAIMVELRLPYPPEVTVDLTESQVIVS